jgi:endonuclease YncB( thermonuclease family)
MMRARPWRAARLGHAGPSRGPLRILLDTLLALAILAALGLVALKLDAPEPREAFARAAIVNDGDSLTLGAERVRLQGIDAPELHQSCRRDGADYACGRRSREALSRLIGGRPVACRGFERDRFGRLVATCEVNGADLNEAQVAAGWAVAYGGYEAVEAEARAARLGLWAGTFERPRDWRAVHGDARDEAGAGWPSWLPEWLGRLLGFS